MLTEFKAFIAKGNVIDLAVAVIIGAAFGAIVKSLTDEIIMPVVGAIFGNIDFSDRYLVLSGEVAPGTPLAAAREAGANVLGLGAFISVVINFLILVRSGAPSRFSAFDRKQILQTVGDSMQ